MRSSYLILSRFLPLVAFVSLAIIGGCQRSPVAAIPSAFTTPQGIQIEKLFPDSTFMLFKIGANSDDQLKFLNQLATYFPTKGLTPVIEGVVTGMNQNLAQYGLTYENDVKPLFGDRPQIFMAFSHSSNKGQIPKHLPYVTSAMLLADVAKADAFMEKLTAQGDYQKEIYKTYSLYIRPENTSYITRVKDVFMVGNQLDLLKSGIDHLEAAEGTLLHNKVYQKALTKVVPSLGFAYLDLKKLFSLFQKFPEGETKVKELFTQIAADSKMLNALEGEIFVLSAEQKGLRIFGAVFGDEKVLNNSDLNFFTMDEAHKPYLYAKLPVHNALMYMEMYNFRKALEYDFKIWSKVSTTRDLETSIRKFFADYNIDFDKDILSFLDRGVAFAWRDSENFVPSLGFYIDAGSSPEGARKIMAQAHTLLQFGMTFLKTRLGENTSALVMEEVDLKGAKIRVARFFLEKLSHKLIATVPPSVLQTRIELWYGVTSDNIAFIALHPDFDKDYGKMSLADNADFKTIQSAFPLPSSGFFYGAPPAFMGYIGHFLELAALADGIDPEQQKNYEMMKAYFAPVKGIIIGSKTLTESESTVDGFVMVGP